VTVSGCPHINSIDGNKRQARHGHLARAGCNAFMSKEGKGADEGRRASDLGDDPGSPLQGYARKYGC
jgi:hypothetical protein